MGQFLAFTLIPILAAVWIAGGSLVFVIEIISSARAFIQGKAIREEINATLGALGLLFVILGVAFRALSEQQERGPQLVLLLFGAVSLCGAIATLFLLWPEIRRKRPPVEPRDDEQPVEDQSEFEAWAKKEAAADVELTRYRPSQPTTHRDKAGNLICRIRFARTDGEATFIAERDPEGINRIHVRSVGKNQIHVRSVTLPRVGS